MSEWRTIAFTTGPEAQLGVVGADDLDDQLPIVGWLTQETAAAGTSPRRERIVAAVLVGCEPQAAPDVLRGTTKPWIKAKGAAWPVALTFNDEEPLSAPTARPIKPRPRQKLASTTNAA